MDGLANAIIEKLTKDGSIKTVKLFSDADALHETPCVIVKPEEGSGKNTRQYRISARCGKGQPGILENYVLFELDKLLLEGITDKDGARYKLHRAGYTDITGEAESGGYFMEGIYAVPMPRR